MGRMGLFILLFCSTVPRQAVAPYTTRRRRSSDATTRTDACSSTGARRKHVIFPTHLFPPSCAVQGCWSRGQLPPYHPTEGGLQAGGGSAESARTLLRSGSLPSTLPAPAGGSASSEVAKARAAAKENQCETKADAQAEGALGGAALARQRASKRRTPTARVRPK